MVEVNFCPYCDAPQHKLAGFENNLLFCKECKKFFRLEHVQFECWKCGSKKFTDSGYPNPDGQRVLQCMSCKKMFSESDFFKKNDIVKNEG